MSLDRRGLIAGGLALAAAGPARASGLKVGVETDAGDIVFELYPERAPVTVANFLAYAEAGLYGRGSFYRTVRSKGDLNPTPINVIQGGLRQDPSHFPPIAIETTEKTGVRHLDGTVSMARAVPGWSQPLATSEFFVCLGDSPALDFGAGRNSDGQGFAAFGKTVSGMEVVRKIHALPTGEGGEGTTWAGQILTRPVKIVRVRRL